MENTEFQEMVGSWHWVFNAPSVLTPLRAAMTGMGERFWYQVHMGRLPAPCCGFGWSQVGMNCVWRCVHCLVDKYPCPADRKMPDTAWTVVSVQVLLQAAWRAALMTLFRPVQWDI